MIEVLALDGRNGINKLTCEPRDQKNYRHGFNE